MRDRAFRRKMEFRARERVGRLLARVLRKYYRRFGSVDEDQIAEQVKEFAPMVVDSKSGLFNKDPRRKEEYIAAKYESDNEKDW